MSDPLTPDLQLLVDKLERLSTANKFRLVVALIEAKQFDLAESVARHASLDFIIHRLHGTDAR